jgi:cytochrome c5
MKLSPFLVSVLLILSGILGFGISLYLHKASSAPVVLSLQTVHNPVSFVQQLKGDPQAGKKIYKEYCASCHAGTPVIDVNAPKLNDKAAWEKWQKTSEDVLLARTIKGVNAMPARGGCFECSDDDVRKAIQYMVANIGH